MKDSDPIYMLQKTAIKNHYMGLSQILKKEDFINAVKKARDYVFSGDIVQVVISQRFETTSDVHPFDIYRALRIINPSPYMFYIDIGEGILLAHLLKFL